MLLVGAGGLGSPAAYYLAAAGIGTVALVASVTGLWVGTVLLAVGMSLLYPGLFTLAVNGAPEGERSHAVGSFSLFFDLSQGLGAPILGIIENMAYFETPDGARTHIFGEGGARRTAGQAGVPFWKQRRRRQSPTRDHHQQRRFLYLPDHPALHLHGDD